jgi:hypothetical protein
MFNVSIREYCLVLNVFIVCIRNTEMFKLIPLLCTHVYLYMFSTVHPPSADFGGQQFDFGVGEESAWRVAKSLSSFWLCFPPHYIWCPL